MESAKFNQSIFKSQDDANLKQSREQVTCKEAKGLLNGQSVKQASNITKPSMRVQSLVEGASGEVMCKKALKLYATACDKRIDMRSRLDHARTLSKISGGKEKAAGFLSSIMYNIKEGMNYRLCAAVLLSEIPDMEETAVSFLVSVIKNMQVKPVLRIAATYFLSKLPGKLEEAISFLVSIIKDKELELSDRLCAADQLREIPGKEEELVNLLVSIAMPDVNDWSTRYHIAMYVKRIPGADEKALRIFLSLQGTPDLGGTQADEIIGEIKRLEARIKSMELLKNNRLAITPSTNPLNQHGYRAEVKDATPGESKTQTVVRKMNEKLSFDIIKMIAKDMLPKAENQQ